MKRLMTFLAITLTFWAAASPAFGQDSLNIRLLGRSDLLGHGNRAVCLRDNYAFVQGNGVMDVLDFTNLDNIDWIGAFVFGDGFAQYSLGLQVRGDYAFVADRFNSFSIGDISDLQRPRRIFQMGYVAMGGYARDIALRDDYAFVLTNSGLLHVFDTNDPSRARIIGDPLNLRGEYLGGELTLAGDYALACAGDLYIISVEDPRRPTLVGSLDLSPFYANEVVVAGQYAYVGSCRSNGGGSKLQILDISDIESPEEVNALEDLPPTDPYHPMDIAVAGDFLIITAGYRLGIIDVADPEHPRQSGWFAPPDSANSVVMRGDLAYVGGNRRLSIYDCSQTLGHPEIDVADEDRQHNFGRVAVGRSEEWTLTINNAGQWRLVIDTLRLDNPGSFWIKCESVHWRLDGWLYVGAAANDSYINGVEFVNDSLYVTGGNGGQLDNWVYVFDQDGRLQRRFPQFARSAWGMRDLAWDGELLWGADGRRLYGFTTDGDLREQFNGPLEVCRSVAYDPDRQLLWVSDITSDILGVTRGGEVVQVIQRPPARMYGMTWDANAPDGFNLALFTSDQEHPLALQQVNPETGELREVNLNLASELEGGRAGGGLTLTSDWNPPLTHFIGTVDGAADAVGVWQRSDFYGGEPLVIEAESSLRLTVAFQPNREGAIESALTIRSDDADEPEVVIQLAGEGLANRAPEWTEMPESIEASPGERVEFAVVGNDPDGDPLALRLLWNDLPRTAIFTAQDEGRGSFDWQTADRDTGEYRPGFVVSDGLLSDTVVVPVRIAQPNSASPARATLPTVFALLEPYPNPFNSTVRIGFALPQASQARLALYDLSGREIALLADAAYPAGYHSLVYAADDLPSGIYLIRGRFGGVSQTAKVTLLK